MYSEKLKSMGILISKFLNKELSENAFKSEYSNYYTPLRNFLANNRMAKPYYPLGELPFMKGPELREYAELALPRIPKEILARETLEWVKENLTEEGDCFRFYNSDGRSFFGSHSNLYSTDIEKSFLLSAMEGKIERASFKYSDLLLSIKSVSHNEPAAWFFCCEPDNAFAQVGQPWTLGEVYEELHHLINLERTDPQKVQAKDCHMVLLPENKKWMLLHTYDFSSLSISLHGKNTFIDRVKTFNKSNM